MRLVTSIAAGAIALAAAGCVVNGYPPGAAPGVQPAAAPRPAAPPAEAGSLEAVIVPPQEAEARGYVWEGTLLQFGDQQDGTKLLIDLLTRAKAKGAAYVSDVTFHFVTAKNGKPVVCTIGVQPQDVPMPVRIPERVERVQVMAPVTQTVTEQQYRCQSVMKPNNHMVYELQNKCQTEMVPVTRSETRYRTEYDYSSKMSRSVPETHSVTAYESRYTCHPENVSRFVTDYRSEQECHMEPVTRTVTRYEFQLQTHFVPPHLEYVQKRKLRETEPVCYVVEGAAPEQQNRLEAKLYFPKKALPPAR